MKNKESTQQPLSEQLRPTTLSEIVGQQDLLGPGKPFAIAFETQRLHSMILWGPPGVGKTTLAKLTAQQFSCEWLSLSAVFAGVKEIRNAIETAEENQSSGKKTILFIDEIHRFNKSQQDALLAHTESGLFTLIGATTENPSFELNRALLSRVQIYVLKPLEREDLKKLFERANQYLELSFELEAVDVLLQYADGDARRLLNLLDQIQPYAKLHPNECITIEAIRSLLSAAPRQFDKSGDHFYDQISALHKSVRGSDPDAALYWLCRMLDGGADPHYLARRIIRMAWEDIGLADPRAHQITQDAATTYERLGSPEGELALAQAVLYLSVAPKSNAGYKAFKQAQAFVKKDQSREVPVHLRNAPTTFSKKQGHGQHYRYAHDEPHGFAAGENYFPSGMKNPEWYKPVDRGLEKKITQKMDFLKKLNQKAKESS